jgi:non-ribosomal peptide synthetase component F
VTLGAGATLVLADADERLGRDATLWNAYGPTETAIVATCHEVTRLNLGPVPIGVPIGWLSEMGASR